MAFKTSEGSYIYNYSTLISQFTKAVVTLERYFLTKIIYPSFVSPNRDKRRVRLTCSIYSLYV